MAKASGVIRSLLTELLSRTQIAQYLRELAELLGDKGSLEKVIVVGGALLAHYGIREGTRDVDSAYQLGEELQSAAAEVAKRHDLAPDWLNARAAPFRPVTLDESDCEVILEHGRLLVLAAPVDQVFLMKVNSARATDQADLVLAWPHTRFETADEVVTAYWEAFPDAPDDEYLFLYVEDIIREATRIP
jgi:hypothetical protein